MSSILQPKVPWQVTQRWGEGERSVEGEVFYLEGAVDGVAPDVAVSLGELAGHVPVEGVAAKDPQLTHLPQLGVLHAEAGEALPGHDA